MFIQTLSRHVLFFAHCLLVLIPFLFSACSNVPIATRTSLPTGYQIDDLLVGACRLPAPIIRLGSISARPGPRKVIMTDGVECGIRGGEFVEYDAGNLSTARKIWADQAQQGNAEAQNNLGEIYERGLGAEQDYSQAAIWYRKAAKQGLAAAQFNLGKLYELGLGVEENANEAIRWYGLASNSQSLRVNNALLVESSFSGTQPSDSPVITLIEPLVARTKGVTVVPISPRENEELVVGRVESLSSLRSITVNDEPIAYQSSGLFEARLPLQENGTTVRIYAEDSQGRHSERSFRLLPSGKSGGVDGFGQYHALIIGVQNYNSLNALRTPLNDAREIGKVLQDRYGFNVRILEDATRKDILEALGQLEKELGENDNLLIYYAGHGELESVNRRGYWLPIDAAVDDRSEWISNTAITDTLNIMNARGILVVSDSCYAGALLRSNSTALTTDVEILRSKRSRTALTSGGLAPVLDDGNNGHSVFANAFLQALKTNEGLIGAQQLMLQIRAKVSAAAYDRSVEQVPMHGAINLARHEGGGFFFVALP